MRRWRGIGWLAAGAAAAAGGALAWRARGRGGRGAVGGREVSEGRPNPTRAEREEAVVTIQRPRQEVWAFWRRLENLPGFMRWLESVEDLGEGRSRWRVRLPAGAGTVQWQAEIVEEREGERLAWRSLPGGDVDTEGAVDFRDAPGGGTEVRVVLRFAPSDGVVGSALGRLAPLAGLALKEQLRHLKQLLEAGESPTTEGQPAGGDRKESRG